MFLLGLTFLIALGVCLNRFVWKPRKKLISPYLIWIQLIGVSYLFAILYLTLFTNTSTKVTRWLVVIPIVVVALCLKHFVFKRHK